MVGLIGILIDPLPTLACSAGSCADAHIVLGDGPVPSNLPALQFDFGGTELIGGIVGGAILTDDLRNQIELVPEWNEDLRMFVAPLETPLLPNRTYELIVDNWCPNPLSVPNPPLISDAVTRTFQTANELPLPDTLGTLEVVEGGRMDISVPDGGMCSRLEESIFADVQINFSPEAEPWRHALAYRTYVDGGRFTHIESLGEFVREGESWVGRGADRIFRTCASIWESPDRDPPMRVRMEAYLPGTDIVLTTDTIELNFLCLSSSTPAVPVTPPNLPIDLGPGELEEAEAGCGCRAGPPDASAQAGWVFALGMGWGFLALRRRRSA